MKIVFGIVVLFSVASVAFHDAFRHATKPAARQVAGELLVLAKQGATLDEFESDQGRPSRTLEVVLPWEARTRDWIFEVFAHDGSGDWVPYEPNLETVNYRAWAVVARSRLTVVFEDVFIESSEVPAPKLGLLPISPV